MKKILLGAVAALGFAAYAMPASAEDMSAEWRHQEFTGGGSANEYVGTVGTQAGEFRLGGEASYNDRSDKIDLSGNLGLVIQAPLGVRFEPRGEIGYQVNDGLFWGVSAQASRPVYGPVSAEVGARYRQGLDAADGIASQRVNAGLSLALSPGASLGVDAYREFEGNPYNAVGVSLRAAL